MRRRVWSRNLKNEEAVARVGPQRHRKQTKKKQTKHTKIGKLEIHAVGMSTVWFVSGVGGTWYKWSEVEVAD